MNLLRPSFESVVFGVALALLVLVCLVGFGAGESQGAEGNLCNVVCDPPTPCDFTIPNKGLPFCMGAGTRCSGYICTSGCVCGMNGAMQNCICN